MSYSKDITFYIAVLVYPKNDFNFFLDFGGGIYVNLSEIWANTLPGDYFS